MQSRLCLLIAVLPVCVLSGCSESNKGRGVTPPREELRDEKANPGFTGFRAERPRALRRPSSFNTESYAAIDENPFLSARENALSTFSIDVDTASYSNMRRFLNERRLPPAGAVRIEELVNYFTYDYAPPEGGEPFSVNAEVGECPWKPEHRLVRIGLRGREISLDQRSPSNLVFLVDVSGSMQDENKLPLVKNSLKMLVDQMREEDRIAIVVYAGHSGLVLPSTTAAEQGAIIRAIENLEAGGSTNGGEGIRLAYSVAAENFVHGGTNRVILCTDGDFNVGVTNESELVSLIEGRAQSGVFLSVLGFGTGNYKDSMMEKLAGNGNGNYAYIDTPREARKVLVEQMAGTLMTIAKDVKVQVDFNPAQVNAYRLIGYENRMLRDEDFKDDKKDAGDIGAGHTVTAFYEIVPKGVEFKGLSVDPSKYQVTGQVVAASPSNELLTIRLRYKQPDGAVSRAMETAVTDGGLPFAKASTDFRFAAAIAEFGMLLNNSRHKGDSSYETAIAHARSALGEDPKGYRAESVTLMAQASVLNR